MIYKGKISYIIYNLGICASSELSVCSWWSSTATSSSEVSWRCSGIGFGMSSCSSDCLVTDGIALIEDWCCIKYHLKLVNEKSKISINKFLVLRVYRPYEPSLECLASNPSQRANNFCYSPLNLAQEFVKRPPAINSIENFK